MANTQTASKSSNSRQHAQLRETDPAELGRDFVQYLREYARENPGDRRAVVLRHRLRARLEAEDVVTDRATGSAVPLLTRCADSIWHAPAS